uniref:Uncharacterized protein n=1 Tax=Strongyloides papillosus TaxID=174720 RepID=A0A0N5BBP0_STREA
MDDNPFNKYLRLSKLKRSINQELIKKLEKETDEINGIFKCLENELNDMNLNSIHALPSSSSQYTMLSMKSTSSSVISTPEYRVETPLSRASIASSATTAALPDAVKRVQQQTIEIPMTNLTGSSITTPLSLKKNIPVMPSNEQNSSIIMLGPIPNNSEKVPIEKIINIYCHILKEPKNTDKDPKKEQKKDSIAYEGKFNKSYGASTCLVQLLHSLLKACHQKFTKPNDKIKFNVQVNSSNFLNMCDFYDKKTTPGSLTDSSVKMFESCIEYKDKLSIAFKNINESSLLQKIALYHAERYHNKTNEWNCNENMSILGNTLEEAAQVLPNL